MKYYRFAFTAHCKPSYFSILLFFSNSGVYLCNIFMPFLLTSLPTLDNSFWLSNAKDESLAHFSRTLHFSHMWAPLVPRPSTLDTLPGWNSESAMEDSGCWCPHPLPNLLFTLIWAALAFLSHRQSGQTTFPSRAVLQSSVLSLDVGFQS